MLLSMEIIFEESPTVSTSIVSKPLTNHAEPT